MPPTRIDRNPQNLPIGHVQLDPVRRPRRTHPWLRFWRRNATALITAIGICLAGLGAILTVYRPNTVVDLETDGVHVGSSILHPAGSANIPNSQLYRGDATYLLVQYPKGLWRGTAITYVGNVRVTGICQITALSSAQAKENCSFSWGRQQRLTAVDVLNFSQGSVWQRTYSDGKTTGIAVSSTGSLVPVPFPIGR